MGVQLRTKLFSKQACAKVRMPAKKTVAASFLENCLHPFKDFYRTRQSVITVLSISDHNKFRQRVTY